MNLRHLLVPLSLAALALTIAAPIAFFTGFWTLNQAIYTLDGATILWFLTAPLWMERNRDA